MADRVVVLNQGLDGWDWLLLVILAACLGDCVDSSADRVAQACQAPALREGNP